MENLENRKVGTKTKEKQRERVNVDRQTDRQTYRHTSRPELREMGGGGGIVGDEGLESTFSEIPPTGIRSS